MTTCDRHPARIVAADQTCDACRSEAEYYLQQRRTVVEDAEDCCTAFYRLYRVIVVCAVLLVGGALVWAERLAGGLR